MKKGQEETPEQKKMSEELKKMAKAEDIIDVPEEVRRKAEEEMEKNPIIPK